MIDRVLSMTTFRVGEDRHEFVWRLHGGPVQRAIGTLSECEQLVRSSRAAHLKELANADG